MKLSKLLYWQDTAFRPASTQMSLDQALFEATLSDGVARARFYHWDQPAVTVGYFHQFDQEGNTEPLAIRRFTGGGVVEHGSDATFALTLPAKSEPAKLRGDDRYRWVHEALATSLKSNGVSVNLEAKPTPSGTGPCFSTPVTWDLLCPEGKKIGGGAQRRSSGAVMHQGSVRLPESLRSPTYSWVSDFLSLLSEELESVSAEETAALGSAAAGFDKDQFCTPSWNRWHEPEPS